MGDGIAMLCNGAVLEQQSAAWLWQRMAQQRIVTAASGVAVAQQSAVKPRESLEQQRTCSVL